MTKRIWTNDDIIKVLSSVNLVPDAQIADGLNNQDPEFKSITLTLTSGTALDRANAIAINFPFKSVYVMATTHPSLTVKLLPQTINSYQDSVSLSIGDSLNFGAPVSRGFIFWDAQSPGPASLTVTLLFAKYADVKSGSLSSIKGGVKTDMYNSALDAVITLAATTTTNVSDPVALTQVASYVANSIDRQVLIQNQTGATLYLGADSATDDGSAAAGIHIGHKVSDGDFFKWNNKAYLYAYSTAGGKIKVTVEY